MNRWLEPLESRNLLAATPFGMGYPGWTDPGW
jgi:hypothetical protein